MKTTIIDTTNTRTSYTKLLSMVVDRETYIVIVKLAQIPNNIRIEYSKRKGGKIIALEEIDALEGFICGCRFRGKVSDCTSGADHLKDLKKDISTMKTSDWINNPEIYIDEYSK